MISEIELEICSSIERTSVSLETFSQSEGVLSVGGERLPGALYPAKFAVALLTMQNPGTAISVQAFASGDHLIPIRSKVQLYRAVEDFNNFFNEVTNQQVSPWQTDFKGRVTSGRSGVRVNNMLDITLVTKFDNTTRTTALPNVPEITNSHRLRLNSLAHEDKTAKRPVDKISIVPPQAKGIAGVTIELGEKIHYEFMRLTVGSANTRDQIIDEIKKTIVHLPASEITKIVDVELRRLFINDDYVVQQLGTGQIAVARRKKGLRPD